MKYVVYYNTDIFGKTLNNKAGKEFKVNCEKVLDTANIIWIPSNHTSVETLLSK
jgi:hypothetical protein